MKTTSRLGTLGSSYLRESLLSKRSQHGWPGSNPVQKGHKPWPSVHVDLVNFRPIQDRIRIGVGDSECRWRSKMSNRFDKFSIVASRTSALGEDQSPYATRSR